MTGAPVLAPLRIPELGPLLGKIVVGTGRRGIASLDGIRLGLVTRIFEQAGEARRLAARDERAATVAAVGRTAWLEAWEDAAESVATALVHDIRRRLADEAGRVGMRPGRLKRYLPTPGEERALSARLASAGVTVVPVLDLIDRLGPAAVEAGPEDVEAVAAWQEALRVAARRLEAAWLALEETAAAESRRWESVIGEVRDWRRPWWPVWTTGAIATGTALWLGLVLGGYLEAPGWFADAWAAIARLVGGGGADAS